MNIKEINNQQLVSVCDKYISNRDKKGLSNEEVSKRLNIPLPILVDLENHIITDEFLIEHLELLGIYFNIKLSDWFEL